MTVGLFFLIVVVLIVLITAFKTYKAVPQASVVLIERFGRYSRTLEPGPHFLMPFIDNPRPPVDLREQVVAFQPQPVITKDNVTISIDTVLYYTVSDPFRATYEVANLILAVEQITITTLRNVIGSLSLDEALTSRDKINADLRIVLDEATERWGIRVNRIEVKSIDPPRNIQEAMEMQMRAERNKRASILNAEGEKQSAILTAEGERQAAILRAEANQKSQILIAEGDKQSQVLRAEGEAQAITNVFAAIHQGNPSPDLLAYQYLNSTLPKVANGQSTKLLMLPNDSVGLMGAASALGAGFNSGSETASSGGTA